MMEEQIPIRQAGAAVRKDLLAAFDPITLEQMSGIRLMNRIDTKFLLTTEGLERLLEYAAADYLVQEVGHERDIPYHTVYFDTDGQDMYLAHQCGHAVREKIRVRTYASSGLAFLEIKDKNNKGRTDKKRIRVTSACTLEQDGGGDFLKQHARYTLNELSPCLENQFQRVTLVNKARTERLTIDCDICFRNLKNGNECSLPELVVVELKRDGRTYSPICAVLHRLHARPASFSKYCMGCALTDGSLKQNRFKQRIRRIEKLTH